MLSIILGIFSSGGFGSIVGLVGGYFNRKLDLEVKQLDVQDKAAERAHSLLKLDKEREYMVAEYGQKLQIATKEGETATEVAGYNAMSESYKFAAPTSADGLVDRVSKAVRPLVTLIFLAFTAFVFWRLQLLVDALAVPLPPEQVMTLYKEAIEWVFFQAGVCIGWWFAMRPGRPPRM